MSGMEQQVFGVSVETWTAIESIATAVGVLAAGVAGWFAYRQLSHNREARLDQSRPYVLASFDRDPTMFGMVDLVIRNIGAGPAHNVTITTAPALKRAKLTQGAPELAESRIFNEQTPLMPPGYELRMFFDLIRERQGTGLPEAYAFTISYEDGHGHSWTEMSVADFGMLNDLLFTEPLGVHHLAYAMRELRDMMKNSPLLKGQVDATTETREKRSARHRAERDEQRSAVEAFREQQRTIQEAAEPESTGRMTAPPPK
jgi:hypothetical protein